MLEHQEIIEKTIALEKIPAEAVDKDAKVQFALGFASESDTRLQTGGIQCGSPRRFVSLEEGANDVPGPDSVNRLEAGQVGSLAIHYETQDELIRYTGRGGSPVMYRASDRVKWVSAGGIRTNS